jgi:sporadic carbohydrate cluster protein (TIGR04323 family)
MTNARVGNRSGYRGYIASRPIRGQRTAQNVQNIVVRNYAQQRKLLYLLSAAELNVPNCFMVLEDVMAELPAIEGIICYSLFMLPEDARQREHLYERVFAAGCEIHAALENLRITDQADVRRAEDIWAIEQLLPDCLPPSALTPSLSA